MSIEANKALVRRYYEDAPSNPAACDEIFAPVVRFHAIHHATLNADVDSSPASEKVAYEWFKMVWGDWRMFICGCGNNSASYRKPRSSSQKQRKSMSVQLGHLLKMD